MHRLQSPGRVLPFFYKSTKKRYVLVIWPVRYFFVPLIPGQENMRSDWLGEAEMADTRRTTALGKGPPDVSGASMIWLPSLPWVRVGMQKSRALRANGFSGFSKYVWGVVDIERFLLQSGTNKIIGPQHGIDFLINTSTFFPNNLVHESAPIQNTINSMIVQVTINHGQTEHHGMGGSRQPTYGRPLMRSERCSYAILPIETQSTSIRELRTLITAHR